MSASLTAPLRASTPVRLARAAVLTAVVAGFGGGAHVAAGGLLPGPVVLAVLLTALLLLSAAALAGPASRTRLVALVAGGQAFAHLALTAAAGHGGSHGSVAATTAAVPADASRRGSLRDLYDVAPAVEAPGSGMPHWVTHVVEDLSGPHALMMLAHLLAAAAVACWLAVGEHALWSLVCLLGAAVLAVLRPYVVQPVAAPRRVDADAALGLRVLPPPLLGAVTRRGPPVPAA